MFVHLCVFLRKSGIAQRLVFYKTLVTFNNCPVVKLCGARPMQLLCSLVPERFAPDYSYKVEIALM
jgi:hypothetical protein